MQLDWAAAHGWPDFSHAENFTAYDGLEDRFWTYQTFLNLQGRPQADARLVLETKGIDYRYSILVDGSPVAEEEGLNVRTLIDLTERAGHGSCLEIRIHPAPKSRREPADRSQADHSCKPAMSYGWDFHPRLIPLGIWDDVSLCWRPPTFIRRVETLCTLREDGIAVFQLQAQLAGAGSGSTRIRWRLFSPKGTLVHSREDNSQCPSAIVEHPELWWPHDHGEPALYTSVVDLFGEAGRLLETHSQRVGARRVRLMMAHGQWSKPETFPKSRSEPPMTLEVNGRRLFVKGANWVSPDVFPGRIDRERCHAHLTLARSANLNLVRMWGGAPAQKEAFYDLCDELGILVWQEFPLACNCYPDDERYLDVLKKDADALIRRLRHHACLALWCGGNELFNSWSGMTDQSLPLRLLAGLCFELDRARPFLPTSPVDGVGHGHYVFRDPGTGAEAWQVLQNAAMTAYCEFGCPGPAPLQVLRAIIPEHELYPPADQGAWRSHHAFGAWLPTSHLYLDQQEHYFGPHTCLEDVVERGNWMQSEGYKGLFEEARRQKPRASMAICWCLNEPWPTAANNSLIAWPSIPKPALAAVAAACRPYLASARIRRFSWTAGEFFEADLWLLNDSPSRLPMTSVSVAIEESSGRLHHLLIWEAESCAPNSNLRGPSVRWKLPNMEENAFTLHLVCDRAPEASSSYKLHCRPCTSPADAPARGMNLG